jgi:CysZ protein
VILRAFALAIEDAARPAQRRTLLLSLLLALGLLAFAWLGLTALLAGVRVVGISWFDSAIAALGSVGALALAWMLFPALTLLMLGFFLDRILIEVERQHYPALGPPRRVGPGTALTSALRILALTLLLNLLALPLYLVPAINFLVYYGLNGYLVGREYFELVALRRMDGAAARGMWRRHRGTLILAGMIVVFLLSLPLVNLVAPVVAAASMLHLIEALRRGTAETFAARDRTGLIED